MKKALILLFLTLNLSVYSGTLGSSEKILRNSNYSDPPLTEHTTTSEELSYEQMWQFVHTCVINEFTSSVMRHLYYRAYYSLYSNPAGLDLDTPPPPAEKNMTAKAVLFLHGTGGHPASFIPMAYHLSDNEVRNLYSAFLTPTEEDPLSLSSITKRMDEIKTNFLEAGYSDVEFTLVGHSLGAIAAAKLAFASDRSNISKIISLAGRLHFIPGGEFDWFCSAAEQTHIAEIYAKYIQSTAKPHLYTVAAEFDEIVPIDSVHIGDNSNNELTVNGWGHGGILFAPEAIEQVCDWIKEEM